ncbi:MAG: carboxypeptidase-like regulatory domain-containing protein [Polaribacter sp.]
MIKKLLLTLLFFNLIFTTNAQLITGKVLSKNTLKPIEGIAIVTNLKNGTTTNSKGVFTLNISNVAKITFTNLNYETLVLSQKNFKAKNYTVYLEEKVNELAEIKLNLKKTSLDSIIAKTLRSMKNNYVKGASSSNFYVRENSIINFKNLELDLDKSALLSRKKKKMAEKELASYANNLKNSDPVFSNEFYGKFKTKKVYSEKIKKYYNVDKIDTVQGFKSMQNNKQITIKKAQEDLQNIILKNLNKDKTYKISSGLFKIEDSLSINEVIQDADSLHLVNTFNEFSATSAFTNAKYKGRFFYFKKQQNFLNSKCYHHSLGNNEFLGSDLMYVLNFKPRKSKSKFSGQIFINPKDFTISKLEYQFAEGKKGQNLNLKWLLGIKVSENVNKVTLYYEKNEEDKVYNSYFKETKSAYAYVHRPIKFKENSKTKNKVKFDIKIEMDTKEIREVYLSEVVSMDKDKVQKVAKDKKIKKNQYLSVSEYNTKHWKNRQLVINYLKKYE